RLRYPAWTRAAACLSAAGDAVLTGMADAGRREDHAARSARRDVRRQPPRRAQPSLRVGYVVRESGMTCVHARFRVTASTAISASFLARLHGFSSRSLFRAALSETHGST